MATNSPAPFKKVLYAVILFVFALLVGTIGYMAVEHYSLLDSLYMTVITLSTVGYGEVHKLSDAGRIFTMLLIIFDLAVFAYTFALMSTYFLEGEFSLEYKTFKMKKSIADLEGHVIICGFGRNGREAARTLQENGKAFVVIEKATFKQEGDNIEVPFLLQEDATQDAILKQAGIDRAAALVTTLPEDADNVFVVLTARELNPHMKIISRASQSSSVRKLKTAGANNVVMPDKLGGVHMATMVISPDIKEFVDLLTTQNTSDFTIRELDCKKTHVLHDLNSWQKTGATILGVKTESGEYKLNPTPHTHITSGQRIIAMGSHEQLNKLQEMV